MATHLGKRVRPDPVATHLGKRSALVRRAVFRTFDEVARDEFEEAADLLAGRRPRGRRPHHRDFLERLHGGLAPALAVVGSLVAEVLDRGGDGHERMKGAEETARRTGLL
ncbi:hypothetical protein [Streptomyces filamentosus]|uniref:hypothetical protein n=1 Tax=Streptomyces filamentosus TaxID=67294 RepID=UPI0037D79887